MEGASLDSMAAPKQSRWLQEYDLRWSKGIFIVGILLPVFMLWKACRHVPETSDKIGLMFLVGIPLMLGVEIWKREKRAEIERNFARSTLSSIGLMGIFLAQALKWIIHYAQAAESATQYLK
ncbi:hypothetical protein SAMN05421770_10377 [Granulicella rosea]|uniref:Uncharacterized protein n=1 Tax=Granulicella rosea TaxID=474952 RepID=A0A239IER6_9BACT|nr:hypothetical protein [Granulicella rosea]SNS92045.1 hypothetical protein SAMN05421770_10377 [Granulicella rosea]